MGVVVAHQDDPKRTTTVNAMISPCVDPLVVM
jgi:hypothetical protein